ncbi:hypothetical protein Bca52824_046169 [Brassica carinata]|uniref:Uncharacterized protein n=1 Tax=Brassica carinata TaxID=52824 RepID=A0A8X7RDX7_BRACI|nr:hypothetical protein Bca52824_046169 [Brassica carinata]
MMHPQGFDTQRNHARVLTGRSLSISGMRSSGIEPTPLVLTSSDMLLFFASFDFCLSMAENRVNGQKFRKFSSKPHSLRDFEEEVKFLREELCMSKSKHLLLLQELESKETELQCSSLSVEKLEETISSLTLESLCEIESMKLDISALEQALVDAMRIQEESIQEKDQLRGVIEEVQFQSREAQEKAKSVEKLNEELRKRIAGSEKSIKEFFQSTKERLESENEEQPPLNGECFFAELSHVFPLSSEGRECFDAIIKRLELPRNVTLIDKMEGMGKQIQLQEDLVKRLKEELKEEKLKAKEEAEDLTQEMAELRYKMTCLVDEERKRRVCVEQASLQRIAEVETQMKRETNKRSSTDMLPLSVL